MKPATPYHETNNIHHETSNNYHETSNNYHETSNSKGDIYITNQQITASVILFDLNRIYIGSIYMIYPVDKWITG